jgi:hypothetical protein
VGFLAGFEPHRTSPIQFDRREPTIAGLILPKNTFTLSS